MSTAPKVIVAAEEEVYDLLAASGAAWDVQHRVETIAQMWDDLGAGRLDSMSAALVFSDALPVGPGELEATLAAMAPYAAVFLVVHDPSVIEQRLDLVRQSAAQQGVPTDAPVFVLPAGDNAQILDAMRGVLGDTVEFPEHWPQHLVAPVADVAPVAPALPVDVAPAPVPALPPMPVMTAAPPVPPTTAMAVSPVAAHAPAPVPPAPQPRPGQTTLAVTSSKGGSGKSTTAMMLAAQIVHSSREAGNPLKVVLVDMDTRDGQVASLIGTYTPTALNIRVSPQWDEATVLRNLVHDPKLGIDALLAPVRPRTADDVGPDFYRQVIRVLQQTHDVVIMDTSVNYLDPLISTVCLPESTAILFVTTLATTSVQGMARALREVTEPVEQGGMGISRKKIGIVVNQSVTDVGMERDQVLTAGLSVPIVGAVPLATKDVLTATNYNRMHMLLRHPLLGPAYFRLASACIRSVPLTPLVETPGQSAVPAAPGAPAAAIPAQAAEPASPPSGRRRLLLGRKG